MENLLCVSFYKHSEISTGKIASARLGQRVTACNPDWCCLLCLHQGCAIYVAMRSTVQIFPCQVNDTTHSLEFFR